MDSEDNITAFWDTIHVYYCCDFLKYPSFLEQKPQYKFDLFLSGPSIVKKVRNCFWAIFLLQ